MQNATGGVNQNLLGLLVMEELSKGYNKAVVQIPTGTGKSNIIAHNHPDVKEFIRVKENKIYGKRGRRIRAAERLEQRYKIVSARYKIHMGVSSKERPHSEEYYQIVEKDLRKMEKELATLKSRI